MCKKVNLTDQELNEWVAVNICKWERRSTGQRYLIPRDNDPEFDSRLMSVWVEEDKDLFSDTNWEKNYFDPCNNLNHTYLMEEKIREMGKDLEYINQLFPTWNFSEEIKLTLFDLAHASARQRVEAAYLTFKEINENRGN